VIFKKVLAVGCVTLLCGTTMAQTGTVSPYTRYGLGALRFPGSVKQVSMGHTGVALSDRDRINVLNPAAMGVLETANLEAAVQADVTRHTADGVSQTTNGSTISYFSLGFPVVKGKWGAALGVRPYSSAGYDVSRIDASTSCNCGRIESTYSGDGDLNAYFLSTGFAPFAGRKQRFYASALYDSLRLAGDSVAIRQHERRAGALSGLSLGVQAAWMFGTLNQVRSINFVDSTTWLDTHIENSLTLRDLYLSFGLMYGVELSRGRFFNLGLAGSPAMNENARRNRLWTTYRSNDFFFDVRDTVEYIVDEDGKVRIPMNWSAGLAYGKKGKWAVTADYTTQQWSDFEVFGRPDSLQNTTMLAAGFEIIPNYGGSRLLENIWYRLGAYHYSSYLQLNGQRVNDYGITIGLGIPMLKADHSRSLSSIYQQKAVLQLAVEAGQEGTDREGLVKHQYVRFHVGVVFREFWFAQRRYD
jgi:hypothetical protein